MTPRRFIYASHKWLAVVTGAFTFLWFASAVAMLLPRDLLARQSEPTTESAAAAGAGRTGPDFKGIAISVPQAIAAVESATAGEAIATTVRVDSLEGMLSYRIDTATNGVWWVNARDGVATTIGPQIARRLVVAAGFADEALGPVERLTTYGPGYTYGPLPAYRIRAEGRGLVFSVDTATGEVQPWSALRRWYRFITGWHTLDFLRPLLGGPAVGLLMWILSIAGTGMTAFGFCILWLHFRQWRQVQRRV
jgi:hypothetical protein